MSTRSWRCWLLAAALGPVACPEAPAQTVRLRQGGKFLPSGHIRLDPPIGVERPSHLPLGGMADIPEPEVELFRRLLGPRRQQQIEEEAERRRFHESTQELAKRLLGDEKLREKVLKGRKVEDLERLKQKVERGEGLKDDPVWEDVLKGGVSSGQLSRREEELLRRWAESLPEPVISGPQGGPGDPHPPVSPPPPPGGGPPPPGSAVPPEPPGPWERFREWAGDLVSEHMDEWLSTMDEWLESPVGQSWRDAVREAILTRTVKDGLKDSELSQGAESFGRYLPRVQDLLDRDWGSFLGRRGLPGAPRLGTLRSARLPAAPRAPGRGTAGVVLWLLLIAVLAAALWRSASWYQGRRARAGRPWRLGPWPVRPAEVSTREELVRAFEHLALLLLGPSARTHHHLALAKEMGTPPALDADRRGEAARELAALYEQARYAPGEDPLGPDELAAARRDLCYLAGVSAA